jgi:erythromycin esterase
MGYLHITAVCSLALLAACNSGAREIKPGDSFEVALKAGETHEYSVTLDTMESAFVTVNQMGIDVVVEVRDAAGQIVAAVDSPNGRNGDEPVLLEPVDKGIFTLRVRPIDAREPAAKYSVRYQWRRDAQATGGARFDAQHWLRERSGAIPASGVVPHAAPVPALDRWLNGVRVVGIGEATHGSRELGDLRLSLTKLLIERYGFRTVAIEASADKYRALAPYIAGETNAPSPSLPGPGWIWIGQRTQRELIEWVRAWNLSHAVEPVRIVGVDANDNAIARAIVDALIARKYGGTGTEARWRTASAELAAADMQSFVFGDSSISHETWKTVLAWHMTLTTDESSIGARLQERREDRRVATELAAAKESIQVLLEFATFNCSADLDPTIPRSRDIYMARRVMAAYNNGGIAQKTVYWAHNAHVAHPKGATRIAGAVLRKHLGPAYVAIATTFGEGGFLAQIPNDPEDDLAISRVPVAPPGSVEDMLARVRTGGSLALWQPDLPEAEVPLWFQVQRRMHWVGGLYKPDTNPSEAFQPYNLMSDFDGVAYLPRAAAEDVIAQPRIPARRRGTP